MFLVGDIGNTEIKICLFSKKSKLLKKVRISSTKLNYSKLDMHLNFLKSKKIQLNKIVFCSVVPGVFKIIKKYLEKNLKTRCYELKKISLKKLVEIKVNKKQIGSDRVANAISVIDNINNFIVVDLEQLQILT